MHNKSVFVFYAILTTIVLLRLVVHALSVAAVGLHIPSTSLPFCVMPRLLCMLLLVGVAAAVCKQRDCVMRDGDQYCRQPGCGDCEYTLNIWDMCGLTAGWPCTEGFDGQLRHYDHSPCYNMHDCVEVAGELVCFTRYNRIPAGKKRRLVSCCGGTK